ncbi:MAG: hypothetical protein AB7N76_20350 [Planctomycetota bacterium]
MRASFVPLAGLALALSIVLPAHAQGRAPGSDYEDWPTPGRVFDDEDQAWRLDLDGGAPQVMPEDPIPPGKAARTPGPDGARERWGGIDFDHKGKVRLEAYFLPVVGLRADVDRCEPNGGILWKANARSGPGIATRLAFGDVVSVGLLYLASRHEETRRDTRLDAHSLYLDVLVGGALNEGPLEFCLFLGAGVGGAIFDFDSGFHDTGGAAINVRLQTALRIMEYIELQAGAGCFLWGYPGETIGSGGFVQLGLALRF